VIGLAAYVVVGVLLLLVGPLQKAVTKSIQEVTHPPFYHARAAMGRQDMPRWKRLVFAGTLRASAVILWPLFLPGLIKEDLAGKRRLERSKERRSLTYGVMGGSGTVNCETCGYKEEIISFLHSDDLSRCEVGFQCQACGKFVALQDHISFDRARVTCECGGTLRRDRPVFCPACRSEAMRYQLSYIT
jgi:hypothetical protein